ncbi:hypothetical protein ElyMa_006232500 [Elysia marginata]|uniref:YqaJ viral recombinase domain-containing protein n=1 Tax=Elysia marginata TaxID=1093978 RepID=A0AAV4H7I2_9GAST|nr:hypothetical protein ElyMa_006232500 [Elysia marginata]
MESDAISLSSPGDIKGLGGLAERKTGFTVDNPEKSWLYRRQTSLARDRAIHERLHTGALLKDPAIQIWTDGNLPSDKLRKAGVARS